MTSPAPDASPDHPFDLGALVEELTQPVDTLSLLPVDAARDPVPGDVDAARRAGDGDRGF